MSQGAAVSIVLTLLPRRVLPRCVHGLCLLVLSSCGGGDKGPTKTPPVISEVRVTAPTTSVQAGATLTFTASAVDANGGNAALAGQTVTWTVQPAQGVLRSFTSTGASASAVGDTPGTATVRATAGGKTGSLTVTVLAAPLAPIRFASMTAGASYTCGVTSAGAGYCWGDNGDGRLGDGTTTNRTAPTIIAGNYTWASLYAGARHTCGITTAGRSYCWGSNSDGQLGNGSRAGSLVPVAVAGTQTFRTLALGALHTCGITGQLPQPGPAYCWGTNAHGELGIPAASVRQETPTVVSGTVLFTGIAAGVSHTCATTGSGPAHCWGENIFAQLGDGTTTQRNTPTAVLADKRHFNITAGDAFGCVIADDARVYCWGDNGTGQIGDGTSERRPAPVLSSPRSPHFRISAAPTGGFVCTSVSGTTVHCWGANDSGQLGVPAGLPRRTGGDVLGLPVTEYIFAGDRHACALTIDGVAWCWGANGQGQLGDGTTVSRHTPARVGG